MGLLRLYLGPEIPGFPGAAGSVIRAAGFVCPLGLATGASAEAVHTPCHAMKTSMLRKLRGNLFMLCSVAFCLVCARPGKIHFSPSSYAVLHSSVSSFQIPLHAQNHSVFGQQFQLSFTTFGMLVRNTRFKPCFVVCKTNSLETVHCCS